VGDVFRSDSKGDSVASEVAFPQHFGRSPVRRAIGKARSTERQRALLCVSKTYEK